jgi:hypothetical protein
MLQQDSTGKKANVIHSALVCSQTFITQTKAQTKQTCMLWTLQQIDIKLLDIVNLLSKHDVISSSKYSAPFWISLHVRTIQFRQWKKQQQQTKNKETVINNVQLLIHLRVADIRNTSKCTQYNSKF